MTVGDRKRERLRRYGVKELFHVTKLANLPGILRRGLRARAELSPDDFEDVAMSCMLQRRATRIVYVQPDHSLRPDEMVPLFFAPRNPMTSRHRDLAKDLCCLAVSPATLCDDSHLVAFTDGNLVYDETNTFWNFRNLERLPWEVIRAEYWTDFEDGSRKRAAEFLVAGVVPTAAIEEICVFSYQAQRQAKRHVSEAGLATTVVLDTDKFFLPPGHPRHS